MSGSMGESQLTCLSPSLHKRYHAARAYWGRALLSRYFRVQALALVSLCLFPGQGHSQSFNCHKAATNIEHAICENKALTDLDRSLARELQNALSAAPDQETALWRSERSWIADRDMRCGVVGSGQRLSQCLATAYASRTEDLNTLTTIRRESTPAAYTPERLLGVWEGWSGPNSDLPIKLVVEGNLIHRGACTRMDYRLVGQRGERFFLEVYAPTYCLTFNARGMYLALSLEAGGTRLTFEDCSSADDLLGVTREQSDVHCSISILTRSADSPVRGVAQLERLEHEGGCDGHRTWLTQKQVALVRAIGYKHEGEVREILSQSADVNFMGIDGWTPLGIAVAQRNLTLVRTLLDAGARRRVAGSVAVCAKNVDVLELLPASGDGSAVNQLIREAVLEH